MKAGHPPHDQFKYEKVGVLPIWAYSRVGPSSERNIRLYYLYRQYSTPTFSYFDLYLYSAYAAHYIYMTMQLRYPSEYRTA